MSGKIRHQLFKDNLDIKLGQFDPSFLLESLGPAAFLIWAFTFQLHL